MRVGRDLHDQAGNQQWFTAAERDGWWRTAAQVPDPVVDDAVINTVWCAPGGLCAAGGSFTDPSTGPEAWVMTQTRGRWQPALEVPGIAALNAGGNLPGAKVSVDAVSCASAGNCAAGGQYTGAINDYFAPVQPFVVTQTNGTWGTAREVPGIELFNNPEWADGSTTLIACPSAGNCTAAGYYQDASFEYSGCQPQCFQTFVVNERHGAWGQVNPAWYGFPSSLTCPASGYCVAAGIYISRDDNYIGALRNETHYHWANTRLIPALIRSIRCRG